MEGCAGWINVGAGTGYSREENIRSNGVVISSDKKYDAHYLIGNYYSWGAAAYGSDVGAIYGDGDVAEKSICPRGWKLPLSGRDDKSVDHKNGTFTYMLEKYGFNFDGGSDYAGVVSSSGQNIASHWIYFLRGGSLWGGYQKSSLRNVGLDGYYWSASSRASDVSYSLAFSGTSINPASGSGRYAGQTVRCTVMSA